MLPDIVTRRRFKSPRSNKYFQFACNQKIEDIDKGGKTNLTSKH